MKKLLPFLFLSGCLDLDALQSDFCPKNACPTGYECVEGYCEKASSNNDMGSMMKDMKGPPPKPDEYPACFTYYFPYYVKNLYPMNVPKVKCTSCTENSHDQCKGRAVKQTACMTDSALMKFEDSNSSEKYTNYAISVDGSTIYEIVERGSSILCERRVATPICNSVYIYVMWWCDSVQ